MMQYYKQQIWRTWDKSHRLFFWNELIKLFSWLIQQSTKFWIKNSLQIDHCWSSWIWEKVKTSPSSLITPEIQQIILIKVCCHPLTSPMQLYISLFITCCHMRKAEKCRQSVAPLLTAGEATSSIYAVCETVCLCKRSSFDYSCSVSQDERWEVSRSIKSGEPGITYKPFLSLVNLNLDIT